MSCLGVIQGSSYGLKVMGWVKAHGDSTVMVHCIGGLKVGLQMVQGSSDGIKEF